MEASPGAKHSVSGEGERKHGRNRTAHNVFGDGDWAPHHVGSYSDGLQLGGGINGDRPLVAARGGSWRPAVGGEVDDRIASGALDAHGGSRRNYASLDGEGWPASDCDGRAGV